MCATTYLDGEGGRCGPGVWSQCSWRSPRCCWYRRWSARLTGGGDGTQLRGLRFLVPNAPGGGYDITARTAAKAMEDAEHHRRGRGVQPARRGWHGRARPDGQRERQRPARHVDGAGRGRRVYTNESPATLTDTTPIARLTRGDRDRRGRQGLAAARRSRTCVGDVEGRPRRGAGRRRLQPRRAGPPRADAHGRGASGSTRATSTTSPTTAAASCSRPCSAGRWRSASPGSASTPTRSRPASCGCWR